jgi:hypothetical protein
MVQEDVGFCTNFLYVPCFVHESDCIKCLKIPSSALECMNVLNVLLTMRHSISV